MKSYRLGFLIFFITPTFVVSCGDNSLRNSKAQNYYNDIYNQVIAFQGNTRLALGSDDQFNEKLIIPLRSDLKYVDLYNGVIKVEPELWNFNPSIDELANHLQLYVKSKNNFKEYVNKAIASLENLVKEYQKIENSSVEITKTIELMNITLQGLEKQTSTSTLLANIENHLETNDYVDSILTINQKPYFNFKLEVSWSSKIYQIKEKNNDEFFIQTADVFLNMHLPYLIRLSEIQQLVMSIPFE